MVGPQKLAGHKPAGHACRARDLLRHVRGRTAHAAVRFCEPAGIIQPGYAFPIARTHADRPAHRHCGHRSAIAGSAGALAVSTHPFRAFARCASRRWRARCGIRHDFQQAGSNRCCRCRIFPPSWRQQKKNGARSELRHSFRRSKTRNKQYNYDQQLAESIQRFGNVVLGNYFLYTKADLEGVSSRGARPIRESARGFPVSAGTAAAVGSRRSRAACT